MKKEIKIQRKNKRILKKQQNFNHRFRLYEKYKRHVVYEDKNMCTLYAIPTIYEKKKKQ
jgi:hypothetical protein